MPAASKSALDMKAAPVQLRSVRAEGNVVVRRGGDELTAPRLTYDPVTHWIRAMGTDQTAAVYYPRRAGQRHDGAGVRVEHADVEDPRRQRRRSGSRRGG